jgi:hypothetical protein
MSEPSFPSFIKWSEFKSTDEDHPDTLQLKVTGKETFESEYSTNVEVEQSQAGGNAETRILPLKSHASNNQSLLNQWAMYAKKGMLNAGREIKILTWLGTSKFNRPIRRYRLKL